MTVSVVHKMKEVVLFASLFFIQHCALLHVAPSIESCPNDSVQIEDTCKCDHKRCSKPPCSYHLNISVEATDTPGNCCPIYSCDGCPNETLIEGKCPCAPDAIINAKGQCECIDPHKRLINNECVCDPDLCELPQICDKNSVSVSDKDGCCVKTKCIRCPDDSFSSSNNDDAIEDKCVCYPCNKVCGSNETAVIIHRGNGFPGNCCDMYQCRSNQCIGNNVTYSDGEIWETEDGQKCKCQGGISFCNTNEEISCYKDGKAYKHNESWMVDSCTNCTCINGKPKCIAHTCEISEGFLEKPVCQPLNCSKDCPDGYKVNRRGCKICRCNSPCKFYDDLLRDYNITRNKLKDILDEYFLRSISESIPSTVSSVSTIASVTTRSHNNTPVNERETWLVHAILWPALAFGVGVVAVILLFMIRKYRSNGSYNTNPPTSTFYERVKLQTDTLFNNNYINKNIKGSV